MENGRIEIQNDDELIKEEQEFPALSTMIDVKGGLMGKQITIENKNIGENNPVFIIAEMSANHLQDFDRAIEIIRVAKECGADAIKLQTYRPDTITIDCRGEEFLASPGSPWEGKNLYELYKKAYTPWEWHKELFEYAKKIGIICFSSPFDFTAIDLLEELDVPAYKIASYEIGDIPLIKKAAETGKPIILSTGIASLSDIELAIATCKSVGNDNIAILKCVSEYPTPYEELNLRTIGSISETFNCVSGLSDHSMGHDVDIAAITLGAKIIEKHLTLSRADGGPDGLFSMEPDEFKKMVQGIRNVEKALGHVDYVLSDKQINCKKRARSLYVVEDVAEGEVFTSKNVKSIRPGLGLHTKYYEEILGKIASCNIKKGSAMKWEYIKK